MAEILGSGRAKSDPGSDLRVAPDETESGVVVEHTLPARKLAPPLDRHSNEDESSFVVEGTIGVREDEKVAKFETGDVAVERRGVWHTSRNSGSDTVRFTERIVSGEFADYFQRSARLLGDDELSEEELTEEFRGPHDRFDFDPDPERVPVFLDRHNIEQ